MRTQRRPCQLVGGIENPDEIVISPDGRRLYATTSGVLGSYLVTFALDPRNGDARRLQCLTNVAPSSCTSTRLQEPNTLIVSPDSRFVYVGSLTESAAGATPLLSVYRAGRHGLIAQQCLAAEVLRDLGCTVSQALGDVSVDGLAETPGGSVVYASATSTGFDERIVAFARDPTTGRLAPLSAPGDCVSDEPAPLLPCTAVALTGTDLAMSPSGSTLYAATDEVHGEPGTFAVAALTPDSASGALSELPGPAGCVAFARAAAPGCGTLPNWAGGLELPTLSAPADDLLAGFDESGGLADTVVQITPAAITGALVASDLRGCEPAACYPLRGTEQESASIASSPDGRSVYVADGMGIAQLRITP